MKSLPIPPSSVSVSQNWPPSPQAAVFEIVKGIAAWTVMQETACDADTALAAIERQLAVVPLDVDARDVMDRISAACLDIVSRDDE